MLMLLLTACGGGGEKDLAADLQRQYAAVEEATMEADITCHYDSEVRTYTLLCAYTPEKSTVTVLAPSNLAGISATVTGGELTLSYDDISLDAGTYSAASISPVAALPRLMEAAASGSLSEQSEEPVGERDCLRLSCVLPDDDKTAYATWFDKETLLPLRSEISVDGTVVFEVSWTNFEVTSRSSEPEGEPGKEPAPDSASEPEMDAAAEPDKDGTVEPQPDGGTDAKTDGQNQTAAE